MVASLRSCAKAVLRKRTALVLVSVFAAWWAVGLLGAHLLTMPNRKSVPPREAIAGHAVEAVATTTADRLTVRGWLVRAAPASSRCVVLAAGIRGNRLAMVERAEWYLAQGWSVLLVDLRGTGESEGARIAMGWYEARDLVAWAAFAATRGFVQIGVHGQSLGAAAAAYTACQQPAPAWAFVVVESCYRDIDAALAARLPWLPRPLLWPLIRSAEWLLDVDAASLCPEHALGGQRAPTLIACGCDDTKVGPGAADALFAASAAAIKQRCDLPGAAHVDLWHAGGGLQRQLAAFLVAR